MNTAATSRRLERALDTAAQARIGGAGSLPGNPLGVETRQLGRLSATVVRQPVLYYGFFSAIRGLHDSGPAPLAEALGWCRQQQVTPRLTTSPLLTDEPTLTALHQNGLRPSGFMSLLYGRPSPIAPAGKVKVVEGSPATRAGFEALWLADAAEAERPFLRTLCAGEFSSWRVYLAFDPDLPTAGAALPPVQDGLPAVGAGLPAAGAVLPAAYGCLYVTEGIGVLASGFTHPASRGKGLQSALLARRIADAATAGCDLVLSTATPGSQSERNIRRAGLSPGYTQTIWSAWSGLRPVLSLV